MHKPRPLPSWSRHPKEQLEVLESVPDFPSPLPSSYKGNFHRFLTSYIWSIPTSCLFLLHSLNCRVPQSVRAFHCLQDKSKVSLVRPCLLLPIARVLLTGHPAFSSPSTSSSSASSTEWGRCPHHHFLS